jgi:hypothetical protein
MTYQQRIGAKVIETPVPITASAVIERGVMTNRVVVKRVRRTTEVLPRVARAPRERRRVKRYRADPALATAGGAVATKGKGKGSIQACIAFPPNELAQLDRMAERVQMSRSHFVRQAVKYLGEKIFPGGKLS